ncbi:MAG: cytochrome B [Bacteroidota bacterium]
MAFYRMLVHLHSGLRWIFLLVLLVSIIIALVGWQRRNKFTVAKNRVFLSTLTIAHLQLVIGFILYFVSPKVIFATNSFSDNMLRFFLIEHILLMITGITLITIGYVKTKKITIEFKKFRNIFWYFFLALIITLIAIPWPWQGYGASWG